MRNLKRVLSLALALVMVLGMMVITTSAAKFDDADEITEVEAVEVLSALGIVQGTNGAFNPNGTFTREAAAKLLTYMKLGPDMAEKLAGTDVFSDVAADRWSAKYIGYCANLGYITGVGDGKFNPSGVLKDIELGKLVLCALGKDPAKYTGANWASAVTIDMLDAGLVTNVTGTAISREDACAMILAGLKYSETPKTWNVIDTKGTQATTDDVIVGNFDEQLDAVLYANILGNNYTYAQAPATDTLMAKVYKVNATRGVDAYGRPANTYTKAPSINLAFADEPYAKYEGTFNKAVVDALTEANIGLPQNATYNSADTVAVSSLYDGMSGLNGMTVELYNNDADKDIDVVVAIESNFAVVKNVVPTVGKTAGSVTITVDCWQGNTRADFDVEYTDDLTKSNDSYDILSAYAKGTALIVTLKSPRETDANLLAVEEPTAVVGMISKVKVESTTNASTVTIDGTTYSMNNLFVDGKTLTIGSEGTLYLDAKGNAIGWIGKAAAKDEYAVMTQIVVVNNASNGSIGTADDKYLEAELVFFDGSKEVVKVAFFQAEISKHEADTQYITALQNSYNNTVVKYAVNAKGEYELTYVSQGVTKANATLADSVTFDGTNLANNSTKFIVRTGANTKQDPYKYAAYTGYANLPVKTLNTGATVTGLKYSAPGDTNVAQYVYITATVKTTSDDGKTVAFVTGAPTHIYVDAQTSYYEYPVIINGETTVLNVANNSTVSAGNMYKIDTLNAKGYVSAVTPVNATGTISTVAKDGIIQLSTGWKTYDETTVVYVIDATAGTVTTADITALDATGGINVGNVYVTYVKSAQNQDTPAIAQIIALKAAQ